MQRRLKRTIESQNRDCRRALKAILVSSTMLLGLVVLASPASSTHVAEDLGSLHGGYSIGYHINDLGQVAGSETSGLSNWGFYWDSSGME